MGWVLAAEVTASACSEWPLNHWPVSDLWFHSIGGGGGEFHLFAMATTTMEKWFTVAVVPLQLFNLRFRKVAMVFAVRGEGDKVGLEPEGYTSETKRRDKSARWRHSWNCNLQNYLLSTLQQGVGHVLRRKGLLEKINAVDFTQSTFVIQFSTSLGRSKLTVIYGQPTGKWDTRTTSGRISTDGKSLPRVSCRATARIDGQSYGFRCINTMGGALYLQNRRGEKSMLQ